MYRKMVCLISLVLLSGVAGNALGVNTRFTNAGGDRLWSNSANWDQGVPGTGDNGRVALDMPGPLVQAQDAVCLNFTGPGYTGTSTMDIDGGTLTLGGCMYVGMAPNGHGTLNVINNGTLNVAVAATAMYVGYSTGCTGTVNVLSGGTINAELIRVGATAGGVGTLTVDGGTVVTTSFHYANLTDTTAYINLYNGVFECNAFGSTSGTGVMDITGGTFIVDGDKTATVAGYILAGKIVGYGGSGNVIYDYDVTNGGKTTVTAIPDPYIARNPSPADGANTVVGDVVLSWSPGDAAVSHDVYFGTDFDAVNDAVRLNGDVNGNGQVDLAEVSVLTEQWLQYPVNSGPSADLNDDGDINLVDFTFVTDNWMASGDGIFRGHHTLDANSYDLCSFDLDQAYYWRIDEVNNTHGNSPWKGQVWGFTVEYVILDDFESYEDSSDLRNTWVANTAVVVHLEETMANDGNSMKYVYDNTGSPFYSEAVSTYDTAQDWTASGAELLVLSFHGSQDNAADAELMYIALEDDNSDNAVVTYNGNTNNLIQEDWEDWQSWIIDLQLFDAGGVDLTKIKKFTIGIGDGTAGSSGTVYFDDIRLDTPKTFSADDYGADPTGAFDSGPAIRAAIADAVAVVAGPISVVQLGSGTYKVSPTASGGICFSITDSNLVVQGQGTSETKLIVSDPRAAAFVISGYDNVFLEDFSIDYDPLPFTQGAIVGKSSSYFDLDIDADFPLLSESWFSEVTDKWGLIFEPDKPRPKAGAPEHTFISSWSHLHDRVWRLWPASGYSGNIAYMDIGDRFVHLARGGNHAICFSGCRNSGIENVTIYTAPVAATVSVACDGMVIRGLTVQRLPDSPRLLTTNADAHHCQRNRKGPLIEDCYFEGMADDAINIYTVPNIVTEVISTTELRVTRADLIRNFDFIQIMNPRAGTILDEVTAIDITGDIVTLEHPVVGVTAGTSHTNADTIYNLSSCGQGYVIRNNHMVGHRRHGMLLRAGGGLVEGNLIEEVSGLGVVVKNEPGWPEGPMAQNVTIRNNTIVNVGYGLWEGGYTPYAAAIQIKGERLYGLAGGHVQRQMYIEDNDIINAPGAAIFIGAAHDVWITGNSSEALPGAPSYRSTGAILLDNCGGVVIDDFTVNDSRSQTTSAVEIESSVDPGGTGVSISNLQGNKTNVIDHR